MIQASLDRFKKLQHPGIIKIYCYFFDGNYLYVIQDSSQWEGESLKFFIRNLYTEGLPEDIIAAIVKNSLLALHYLHKNGQPLFDYRARNLILNRDGKIVINPISLRTLTNAKNKRISSLHCPRLVRKR